MTHNSITPTIEKAMRSHAGPPMAKALPHPMKSPAPIEPPIAMNCRCRPFKERFSGDVSPSTGFEVSSNEEIARSRRLKESANLTAKLTFLFAGTVDGHPFVSRG